MDTERETSSSARNAMEIDEVENTLILKLSPKAQRFVHLYVTGQYSNSKIADLLNVHVNTIFNWMRSNTVKEAIADMQAVNHEMVATRMKGMTSKAMQRMAELMDSPIDGVALQAVKDVLDRSGHKQETKITVDKTVRTFEQKIADVIEATISEDDIDDVEFEEVEDD